MSQADVLSILRDAVYTVIICAAPMLIVAIAIGLIISIFQATTQINEQTLAYAPKVVGILLAVMFFGSMIMSRISEFTINLINSINVMIR
ncbi:MAG: flagellar biosynthesis protein FliQ [Clostridiales bacterium]|nr:flagellar biosynthesis protein FliQ [Clostridiales bacterium]